MIDSTCANTSCVKERVSRGTLLRSAYRDRHTLRKSESCLRLVRLRSIGRELIATDTVGLGVEVPRGGDCGCRLSKFTPVSYSFEAPTQIGRVYLHETTACF